MGQRLTVAQRTKPYLVKSLNEIAGVRYCKVIIVLSEIESEADSDMLKALVVFIFRYS